MRRICPLLLIILVLQACDRKEQVLYIASEPGLREFTLGLVAGYTDMNPGSTIMVSTLGEGVVPDSIGLVISNDSLKGLPRVMRMANRAIVVVFNGDHPAIQSLAGLGAGRAVLAAAFRGDDSQWSDLNPAFPSLRISKLGLRRENPAAVAFYSFLQAVPDSNVFAAPSPEALTAMLINDPLGLGFLPCDIAFDARTGFRRAGLYILPLDLDSSGRISDDEFIYDNLGMLGDAVNDGRYPADLIMPVFLSSRSDPVAPAGAFIEWYRNEGRKACEGSGFLYRKPE